MNRTNNERFIIFLVSLACIGLTIENFLVKWEFWVPPLMLIGMVSLWFMHITSNPEYKVRKVAYLVYAMLLVFYHGIHETSYYDIAIVIVFVMTVYSFLDTVYMMNMLLAEYIILMGIQIYLAKAGEVVEFDIINISRIILYIVIVAMVYFCCVKAIHDRAERLQSEMEKDERIEAVDADMEDFLSNISHELRTPVNVVLGMSQIQIKKHLGDEAFSIKSAGDRLAYQIEDIQDYTECKRNKVILEEDDYMSTSLINDVVTGFRALDNERNLELIVDMDPNVPTKMRGDVKKLHKIFRHLLENAVKFTKQGGIYVRLFSENTAYGINLCIEMTDTGIGMDMKSLASVAEGMYQVNKKRNRSSGGIGLGLFIVYGFAHRMGGFVKIESEKRSGTTVKVTIPQKVLDPTPCLILSKDFSGDILFHVRSDKYKVPKVREFYRSMATNLATGIKAPLFSAETVDEIERLKEKLNVSVIFMGQEEYEKNPEYFDEMSKSDIVIAVSAGTEFKPNSGSRVLVMPKPLYSYPVIRVLNEGRNMASFEATEQDVRPVFKDIRALVVDDEPMNLVVVRSLFNDYEIQTDTADSGKDAINKFRNNDYDVVFMDHMMPEMDGVEAMKIIKADAAERNKNIIVIALTANAVSGAREMFIKEGFDGFIAKPISIADFERVMLRELTHKGSGKGGQTA
ncbi:response regulator [Butyrivibrio sp. VCD2006]|uniref:response regulator n=1 Tax=Butyrivibrio sp. VCD2006 TaxID=1280664 RepID=UPI0003FBA6DA|nr:response regulator [Butyrivibrio sp. VCD2006]